VIGAEGADKPRGLQPLGLRAERCNEGRNADRQSRRSCDIDGEAPDLTGWRLLVVQMLTPDEKPDGEPVLAIDHLGAGWVRG